MNMNKMNGFLRASATLLLVGSMFFSCSFVAASNLYINETTNGATYGAVLGIPEEQGDRMAADLRKRDADGRGGYKTVDELYEVEGVRPETVDQLREDANVYLDQPDSGNEDYYLLDDRK